MEERRKHVRDRVKAKATLQHAAVSANVYDLSERGIGLRIPKTIGGSMPSVETIQLSTADRKIAPCMVEANLKWKDQGARSTLVGFEIKSLQSASCKDVFAALSEQVHGPKRSKI